MWRELATAPDLDVHVFYGSDFGVRGYQNPEFGDGVKWDVPLTEGYPHTFLYEASGPGADRVSAVGLREGLEAFRPDVALLTAYMPSCWWRAFGQVRSVGVPVLLHWLYAQCAGFLAIGHNARQHYLSHGVPARRIGWAPYCVDNPSLARQVTKFGSQRAHLRREMGFRDDHTVLIFSGKLVPKKDPMTLARALHLLAPEMRERIGLIVMGDGELRDEFEAECRRALGGRCWFPGFVNQTHLGAYYAAGDCLVLPSVFGETWGLVVNEALQFGLPAIVSDGVGCHPDLIAEGATGSVFPAGDAAALADRISRMGRAVQRSGSGA